MKKFLLTLLLLLAPAVYAFAAPAPSFSVKDIDGKIHTLADYRGKIVVLEWFNASCPFVKKLYEAGVTQKLQETYTQKGVIWLTVNSSGEDRSGYMTPQESREQIAEWKMHPSAFIIDSNGALGKSYEAKTTPHMFIVDQNGELAYQGAFDDKPSASKSSLEGARNYVSTALDEILSSKKVSTPTTESYGCSIKYSM